MTQYVSDAKSQHNAQSVLHQTKMQVTFHPSKIRRKILKKSLTSACSCFWSLQQFYCNVEFIFSGKLWFKVTWGAATHLH